VPAFFTTGTEDLSISPLAVEKIGYDRTKNVPKLFANMEGADHYVPTLAGHNEWAPYILAMFRCHLEGKGEECERMYGQS